MFSTMHFDWSGISFFGAKVLRTRLFGGRSRMVLAQVFNRQMDAASVRGVSLLQIGKRHLLYVGAEAGEIKLCVGFCWLTKPAS